MTLSWHIMHLPCSVNKLVEFRWEYCSAAGGPFSAQTARVGVMLPRLQSGVFYPSDRRTVPEDPPLPEPSNPA